MQQSTNCLQVSVWQGIVISLLDGTYSAFLVPISIAFSSDLNHWSWTTIVDVVAGDLSSSVPEESYIMQSAWAEVSCLCKPLGMCCLAPAHASVDNSAELTCCLHWLHQHKPPSSNHSIAVCYTPALPQAMRITCCMFKEGYLLRLEHC